MNMDFKIQAPFEPAGDQPQAIANLAEGVEQGLRTQVLLGATGTGKTYTIAQVINKVRKPTLVIAHNKTLAAQLASELKAFFPENAVEYFVSYYDYYQPEAYIPQSDTYIEKDASINDEIDKLRHSATSALFERKDVIIVASVSCIYGLGAPQEYYDMVLSLRLGQIIDRQKILHKLVEIQYTRNDIDFKRGTFRVRGDVIEVIPAAYGEKAVRIEMFDDEVDRIVEFDVLTGMQTNALSVTATSAMRVVNRNLDSLFRVFGADGYRTSFYHPGDAWFYNRENVYRWLGAEHEVFAKDMKDLEYKGRWVTDDYMAGLIEEEFETAVSEGRPLFNYTTTIQNHMSYTADKYGEGYVFPPVSTTADISPETRSMLEVYTEGVRDADAMLGRLTAYFSDREEPVVLVFYGDHLPYLGDNQKGYAELGSEVSIPENEREDILCSYKTPYVLWANDAAADTLNWNEAVAALDLPEDGVLSASFLGSVLLDLTGRAGESPWFDFLSSLRRIAPVVQKKTYILADGSVLPQRILNEQTDESSMELKDAVRKWRCWSYYKLKYAEVG